MPGVHLSHNISRTVNALFHLRQVANLVLILSSVIYSCNFGDIWLRLQTHNTPSLSSLLLLLMGLICPNGPDKRTSVRRGMDKMSKVPPCPCSADISWLALRVCVGSICKVPVFWQKRALWELSFFFFFFPLQKSQHNCLNTAFSVPSAVSSPLSSSMLCL